MICSLTFSPMLCRFICLQGEIISGGGSSKLLKGDRNKKKLGLRGGYTIQKSSVLAHLFTAYGKFYYVS